MSPHLLFVAIDVIAIFGGGLLAAHLLATLPESRNAQLVVLVITARICHVLLTRQEYGYWIPSPLQVDVGGWAPLLNIGRNGAPGLYMLLCYSLFQEGRRFPRWLLALFVLQLLLEEPVHLLVAPGAPLERPLTETVPSLLQALFIGFALFWTLADWRSDLVETRRLLRALFLVVIGVQMLASSLLLRVIIPGELILSYYVHVALVGFGALVTALVLFRLMGDDVARYLIVDRPPASAEPAPAAARADPAEDEALARLQALLERERIYREAGLSLGELAGRLKMPEYRLRKLIHEHLGQRNFNAFLHEYRIREACGMLRDPEMARTPILTIALSVGYRSVNTFNRGFRAVMGMTPSQYRAQVEPGAAHEAPERAGG